jgi:hypothetical protein
MRPANVMTQLTGLEVELGIAGELAQHRIPNDGLELRRKGSALWTDWLLVGVLVEE